MRIRTETHDSHLGRWLLALARPPRLSAAVDGIWYFEGALTHLRERHFPHGLLEMVVHLGPAYRRVEGERSEPFTRTCISGLQLASDVIEAPPGLSAVLGVRLHPLGAFRILRRPLHELTGLTADLEDVVGDAAEDLADRCAGAATAEQRLRAAAAWLEARLAAGPEPDAAVAWVAGELVKRSGAASIAGLRDRTGWSRTRFTSAFREQVGVPPKTLARVLRFRRAMELVSRADSPLVQVALEAGYYDQPHFNAEFRALSGFSPGEYLALRRYPESVSVAESS